jgi:hypothetical protein
MQINNPDPHPMNINAIKYAQAVSVNAHLNIVGKIKVPRAIIKPIPNKPTPALRNLRFSDVDLPAIQCAISGMNKSKRSNGKAISNLLKINVKIVDVYCDKNREWFSTQMLLATTRHRLMPDRSSKRQRVPKRPPSPSFPAETAQPIALASHLAQTAFWYPQR